PGATRKKLENPTGWARSKYAGKNEPMRILENIEIAGLTPGRDLHVFFKEEPERMGDKTERPIVVQGSCGLGRVVLVAFDLDTAPFTAWNGQSAFWNKLLEEFAPRADTVRSDVEWPELGADLRGALETFSGVTPVSFGWVALFILIYIIM